MNIKASESVTHILLASFYYKGNYCVLFYWWDKRKSRFVSLKKANAGKLCNPSLQKYLFTAGKLLSETLPVVTHQANLSN